MVSRSTNIESKLRQRSIASIGHDIAATATVLLSVLWVLNAPLAVGVALYREQFLSAVIAAAVAAVLFGEIADPAASDLRRVLAWIRLPIYVGAFLYVAADYNNLLMDLAFRAPNVIAVGIVMIVAICDAVFRTAGLGLFSVLMASLALVFLPASWMNAAGLRPGSLADSLPYLALDPGSVFGPPLVIGSVVVPAFIVFGQVMFSTKGGDFLLELALRLMGRFRGGAAKVAVIASALFGTISGSAVSNVVSTGVFTMALMRRTGYRPTEAAAIEAVASTGSQLMPPVMGASVFIMAEYLQIDYTVILRAALIPALLYYFSLFVIIDRIGQIRDAGRVTNAERVTLRFLAQGGHFFIAIVILLIAMLWLRMSPEASALITCAFLLVTTALTIVRTFDPGLLIRVAHIPIEAGTTLVPLLCILAGAGLVIGAINFTGVAFNTSLFLIGLSGGNLFALLVLSAIACIILGMGMPTTGVYVLLATLVAPSIVRLGVEPMAAHLFILYFGMMSMLTPPIALAAFAAASLVGERPLRVALLASGFGWIAYVVPFAFVYNPALILQGSILNGFLAAAVMAFAVWFVSSGAFGRRSIAVRVGMMSLGFALMGIVIYLG